MELSKDKCQMSTQVSTSSTRLSVENRARLGRLEDTLDFSEKGIVFGSAIEWDIHLK